MNPIMSISDKINALRALMTENGWDAVVLSGSDPHCSEYPAPRWKQVEWLTGFTGEAGDVVVTADHAGLWTDTRYFIQAEDQLKGTGVELHKMRIPGAVGIPEWLSAKAAASDEPMTVTVDGLCWSGDSISEMERMLKAASPESCIVSVPDLLDCLWKDRPEIPHSSIRTLDPEVSGVSERYSKLTWLRKQMLKEGVDYMLISSLDEIAWLLNVRANDIEYNPYSISYLMVTDDSAQWFVKKEGADYEEDQETMDSFAEIETDGVEIMQYNDLPAALEELPDGTALFVDPSSMNWNLLSRLSEMDIVLHKGTSPVILEKAVKTESEISVLREAYIEDGVAVERFLHWLDMRMAAGNYPTEWEASLKLESFRAEIPDYRGDSFACISAYGASAALPHYCTSEKRPVSLQPRGLYLVDSGGQYLTGTTDITRTVPMGPCTDLECEDYTLVLKGMIDLSMAVFPKGTAGCQIDALAREPLWGARRNFGHGTGHGVGFYLGVHEGPQDIRQNFNSQPLLPGMVTSNEPGLYREGMHGIRHENILLTVQDSEDVAPGSVCESVDSEGRNEFGQWLHFETLTLCHIDTSAVRKELLTSDEITWLNAYNTAVYAMLSPRLNPDEAEWLYRKTQSI